MCSREDAVFIVFDGKLIPVHERANPYHDKAGKFAPKNSKGFVHSDKIPEENKGGPILHRGIVAEAQDVDYESTKRIAEGRANALSTVERRIVKKPNICKQCQLNDDPNKVPVHPNCDCDVVTDSIESGVADPQSRFMKALHRSDILMQMFGDAEIPEAIQLDPVTTAIMEGDSVRFSDLARWMETMQPYLETGAQFVSIVVDDDTPEAAQQVSEAVASVAENIENLPEAIRNKKLWFSLAKSVVF